jgi:hypothetical protein
MSDLLQKYESLGGCLADRGLYDICFTPEGDTCVIAPHALYVRSTWDSFGLAHITDLHQGRHSPV